MSPRTSILFSYSFWSSSIMYWMLLFTFENKDPIMREGASVVWHLSFPLLNIFQKPRLLFSITGYASSGLSLFLVQFYLLQLVFSACVAAIKCRPVLHHCVAILFWSSWIVCCQCTIDIFHNHWWTTSIKPRMLFSNAGYASWGLSRFSVLF